MAISPAVGGPGGGGWNPERFPVPTGDAGRFTPVGPISTPAVRGPAAPVAPAAGAPVDAGETVSLDAVHGGTDADAALLAQLAPTVTTPSLMTPTGYRNAGEAAGREVQMALSEVGHDDARRPKLEALADVLAAERALRGMLDGARLLAVRA